MASWHSEGARRGGAVAGASLPAGRKLAFPIFRDSIQKPMTTASPVTAGAGHGRGGRRGCRWPADTTAGKLETLAQAWLFCWVLQPLGRGGRHAAGASEPFLSFSCPGTAWKWLSCLWVSSFPCPSCSWSPSCNAPCNYALISQPFVLGRCL